MFRVATTDGWVNTHTYNGVRTRVKGAPAMAPFKAEAWVMAVLAAVIQRGVSANRAGISGRAKRARLHQLYPRSANALAWGHRRGGTGSGGRPDDHDNTYNIDQIQQPDRVVTGNQSPPVTSLSPSRSAPDAAYPNPAVVDDSWTKPAFKAFHEMRAGRAPRAAEEEEDQGQEEPSAVSGPLATIKRLALRFPRSIGDGDKPENTPSPATAEKFDTAQDANTGPPDAACWHMRGRLTNADTGQTIALVEGVELSRSLALETSPSSVQGRSYRHKEERAQAQSPAVAARQADDRNAGSGGRQSKRCTAAAAEGENGELEVDRMLDEKPGAWTAFGTLASSKFFMYQDPHTGEPMEHFRNTPVEKKQMVRTYERFSQIVSHLLQPNGRVTVVSEWNGRSVKAETRNSNGVEEMDGGKGWRRDSLSSPSSPQRVFNLHFYVEARTPKEERALKRWRERPFGKWVAFGASPPPAHGCKEVYSYVTGDASSSTAGTIEDQTAKARKNNKRAAGREPEEEGKGSRWLKMLPSRGGIKHEQAKAGQALSPTAQAGSMRGGPKGGAGGRGGRGGTDKDKGAGGLMSYTRYGECPTWYGTGRMCGLDVQAKRVGSFVALPAKLKEKVLEVDPDFERGPPATLDECRAAMTKETREKEAEGRRRRKRSLKRPFGAWGASTSPSNSGVL